METLSLPLARYRLLFRAFDAVGLPDLAGSAWRGAFGHALKHTVCVTRMSECSPCLLYGSCSYSYIFETPPPLSSAKMCKYPERAKLARSLKAALGLPAGQYTVEGKRAGRGARRLFAIGLDPSAIHFAPLPWDSIGRDAPAENKAAAMGRPIPHAAPRAPQKRRKP